MNKNEVLMKKNELEEKRFFEFVNDFEKRGMIVEVDQPEWYGEKLWVQAREGEK